jgi:hypothetical protein
MKKYDLGIAYLWEYDEDFIQIIERTLQDADLSTFLIHPYNFPETYELIKERKLGFNYYLDRAWDVDEGFEKLGKMISRRKCTILNPYKNIKHAIDKASMHMEFITSGIHVPYSIIIPPHSEIEHISISLEDLAILGNPFIIKPCNTTGGGIGVVTGAETLLDVLEERIKYCDDKYILQEKIHPVYIENKRAWFRCFWAFGKPIPVWWDDQTHIYQELNEKELIQFKLRKLNQITKKIAAITNLDFFSTEIVLTEDNNFVVIDYMNDQCDMRLKSIHADGIPDNVVYHIINNLLHFILIDKRRNNIR